MRGRHYQRPLSKHGSLLRGYGPTCWAKVFGLRAAA
ncbi:DUF6011 domain-containing protein [Mycobacterium avium]|nr:DUF6011 domain-containing protein [Mycobacterium avium]